MKQVFLTLILLSILSVIRAQDSTSLPYLKAFAKAYGYIRYFHPSDEASAINWDLFAIYGAEKMTHCKTTKEAQQALNELFSLIAPLRKFVLTDDAAQNQSISISRKHCWLCKTTYWQHLGAGSGTFVNGVYKSVRVHRKPGRNAPVNSIGNLLSYIDAKPYRGKEFRFSGFIKVENTITGNGHLWARVDLTTGGTGFFENMDGNPAQSPYWRYYSITGTIDSLANNLVFGCYLNGTGKLYLDNIRIEIRDDNEWKVIDIPNSDFEKTVTRKSTEWKQRGDAYTFEWCTTEKVDGKASMIIRYNQKQHKFREKKLFSEEPEDIFTSDIGCGITLSFPLKLYGTRNHTWPQIFPASLYHLNKDINCVPTTPDSLSVRLANCIITWNVFQHFYPYWDEVPTDWTKELDMALLRSFSDHTTADHIVTLEKMTATLHDGHINLNYPQKPHYVPPFKWEWVENQLIITDLFSRSTPLSIGDTVTEIDGVPAEAYFREVESRISGGTNGYIRYRSQTKSLLRNENDTIHLKVNNNHFPVVCDMNLFANGMKSTLRKETRTYYHPEEGIIYLNLDQLSMDTIRKLMPQLQAAKAIICDLRGYPYGNDELLCHFMNGNDTTKGWMKIPQFIYPDHRVSGYEDYQWGFRAKKPYLGGKVVFITDGRAISYAESYMGYVEGYRLGPIVGQPTAGTNGNVAGFRLHGGISMNFTGMKVVKHDGSQHHGIGILPTVPMTKTVQGVVSGRDEFLEKALEIAREF